MRNPHENYLNFEMEVTSILQSAVFELSNEDKVLVIKNQLGREGLNSYKHS